MLEASAVPVTMEAARDADEMAAMMTKVLESKQPLASRLVRVHDSYWMRIWLESGAMQGAGRIPTDTKDVEDYVYTVREGVQREGFEVDPACVHAWSMRGPCCVHAKRPPRGARRTFVFLEPITGCRGRCWGLRRPGFLRWCLPRVRVRA